MSTARKQNFLIQVKTALLKEGLTMTALAERIGRNRSVVSQAVHGRANFPRVRRAICQALKISTH